MFFKLITGNCNYCGTKPILENKRKHHAVFLNGIDRVDSKKGYIKENVVSCCSICNSAKGILSLEEFKKWIQKISNYQNENLDNK